MSIIIAISRYLLPILTLIILTKCVLSLLLGHPKEKTYGYIIDMADGEPYALNMWETAVGRSNSCDIVIGYDTVSRFHAVISRRIDGWYVYDLLSKSGILLGGEKIDKKATIKSGDVLSFGAAQFRFMVADDPVVRVGKKNKKSAAKPAGERQAPKSERPPFERSAQAAPGEPNAFETGESVYGDVGYGAYRNPSQSFEDAQGSVYDNAAAYEDDASYGFYSQENKPHLNFEAYTAQRQQNEKSDSIFTSYDVQTPPRSQAQEFRFAPRKNTLVNRDTGETFILCGNLVSIGRGRSNDIKLGSPAVSRKHANLVLYEDGWAIDDAGSTAGTYLNGTKISEPQLLFEGDIIGLGDERLTFTSNPSGLK